MFRGWTWRANDRPMTPGPAADACFGKPPQRRIEHVTVYVENVILCHLKMNQKKLQVTLLFI